MNKVELAKYLLEDYYASLYVMIITFFINLVIYYVTRKSKNHYKNAGLWIGLSTLYTVVNFLINCILIRLMSFPVDKPIRLRLSVTPA